VGAASKPSAFPEHNFGFSEDTCGLFGPHDRVHLRCAYPTTPPQQDPSTSTLCSRALPTSVLSGRASSSRVLSSRASPSQAHTYRALSTSVLSSRATSSTYLSSKAPTSTARTSTPRTSTPCPSPTRTSTPRWTLPNTRRLACRSSLMPRWEAKETNR
jgi:hypothetical protein